MAITKNPADCEGILAPIVPIFKGISMVRKVNKLFFGHVLPSSGQFMNYTKLVFVFLIDLVVADLTMTSEREEIIDYISPYFDQAGISIIVRKKFKEQSLFKFLQVLKLEVWLGILGAVIVTALLLWVLDRFSPYSARNNK